MLQAGAATASASLEPKLGGKGGARLVPREGGQARSSGAVQGEPDGTARHSSGRGGVVSGTFGAARLRSAWLGTCSAAGSIRDVCGKARRERRRTVSRLLEDFCAFPEKLSFRHRPPKQDSRLCNRSAVLAMNRGLHLYGRRARVPVTALLLITGAILTLKCNRARLS